MTVARACVSQRVCDAAIQKRNGVWSWSAVMNAGKGREGRGVARGGAAVVCILTARRHDVSAFGTEAPTSEEIYRGDTWARENDNCLQLGQGYVWIFSSPLQHLLLLPSSRCPVKNYSDIENAREGDLIKLYSKISRLMFRSLKYIQIHIFLKISN